MNIIKHISIAIVAITSVTGCTSTQYSSRFVSLPQVKNINVAPTIRTLSNVTRALTPLVLTLAQPVIISPRIVISN